MFITQQCSQQCPPQCPPTLTWLQTRAPTNNHRPIPECFVWLGRTQPLTCCGCGVHRSKFAAVQTRSTRTRATTKEATKNKETSTPTWNEERLALL